VHFDTGRGIPEYLAALNRLFPGSEKEIRKIGWEIRKWSKMTATLNRLPNPYLKNPLLHMKYLFTRFIPWLPGFLRVLVRTGLNKSSVEGVLASITENQSLNDMVSQHFFKGTPAPFAFGYFESFQDYLYPTGGTGSLPKALEQKILALGGEVEYNSEAAKVFPESRRLAAKDGSEYAYDQLLWSADLKSLYQRIDDTGLPQRRRKAVEREKQQILSVKPGESVFTLFLGVDKPPEYFQNISQGHFIYTPDTRGLGSLHRERLKEIKSNFSSVTTEELFSWAQEFCARNAFEIGVPALRDASLAPANQTGLVVSLLCDGEVFQLVKNAGWLAEFREHMECCMVNVLDRSVYPGLKESLLFSKSATPITLMKRFDLTAGAITGWSLEEKAPVPNSLAGIFGAPKTVIPNVYKAGQWSYSPSGVPIAVLTGRAAAGLMS
ncbi:MAG: phytoene desaturase family protein, partial [Spirochaetia bacterium]